MSWDIYGEPLRPGHCEVHPHVHEEYPCSVCISANQARDQDQYSCRGGCDSERYLGQAQKEIERLNQAIKEMKADIRSLAEIEAAAIERLSTELKRWEPGELFAEAQRIRQSAKQL